MTDNENDPEIQAFLRRKIRRRFVFTAITCAFYFVLALAYTTAGSDFFAETISASSSVSRAQFYFFFLIVLFVGLQFVYLRLLHRDGEPDGRGK